MAGSNLVIIAGPCSIESEDQLRVIAESVKSVGADYLRGGAFKPRTSAGDWTGHGKNALGWMRKIGDEFGLKIVTEILDPRDMKMFSDYGVDLYQVGARNSQNQALLVALGEANVPVLLKNGMNTTLKEWLGSAGRMKKENVMLCARGKNNETDVARNGQDVVTLVELVSRAQYPVIFDPSHTSGRRELVYGVTMAAVAAGVDGIIVEVHNDPLIAKTDGRQSITPKQLELLVDAAQMQREFYLGQKCIGSQFASSKIPDHVDIFFNAGDYGKIKDLLGGLKPTEFYIAPEVVLTARIPAGSLGVFRPAGYAIGELVKYAPKEGEASAEAVHVTLPSGEKIKMTPFSIKALKFRGREADVSWPGKRVELVHGYPGQTVKDAYLTINMSRVEGLDVPQELKDAPLVIYKLAKG